MCTKKASVLNLEQALPREVIGKLASREIKLASHETGEGVVQLPTFGKHLPITLGQASVSYTHLTLPTTPYV